MIAVVCVMAIVVAMLSGGLVTWVAVSCDDRRRAKRAYLAWSAERIRSAA